MGRISVLLLMTEKRNVRGKEWENWKSGLNAVIFEPKSSCKENQHVICRSPSHMTRSILKITVYMQVNITIEKRVCYHASTESVTDLQPELFYDFC
jgi:hypothetical protein